MIFQATGFLLEEDGFYYLISGLPFSLLMTLYYFYENRTLKKGELPRNYLFVSIFSSFIGLMWVLILSTMLVDMLSVVIVVFEFNAAFVGLTVLGIASAMPDSLTTITLAR